MNDFKPLWSVFHLPAQSLYIFMIQNSCSKSGTSRDYFVMKSEEACLFKLKNYRVITVSTWVILQIIIYFTGGPVKCSHYRLRYYWVRVTVRRWEFPLHLLGIFFSSHSTCLLMGQQTGTHTLAAFCTCAELSPQHEGSVKNGENENK